MDDNNPSTSRTLHDSHEPFLEVMTKVLRGFEARMIAAFHSYDNYPDGITAHHTDDAL
jgi:hypothetical protein